MSFKSQERYRESDSNRCPSMDCGVSDIEGGSIEIEGRFAVQEVSCLACGCVWNDTYALSSYEVTEQAPRQEGA